MDKDIDIYLYDDNPAEEEACVLYNENTIKLFNFLYYITNLEQKDCN